MDAAPLAHRRETEAQLVECPDGAGAQQHPADLRRQWIQGTGPAAKPNATVEAGIRNVAHALLSGADGWMFDGGGQCVDQPAEHESFKTETRIRSYPVEEYLGLIFAWFGDGYWETDDYSYNAVSDPTPIHDVQATVLHCLGIDHTRLTYKFQGRHFRLTDIAGSVTKKILA